MLHAVRFINSTSLITNMNFRDTEPVRTVNRNLVNSRFGFLSCITGLTSVCLFGLTLAMCLTDDINDVGSIRVRYRMCPKQWDTTQRHQWSQYQCKVDIILKILAFFFTFGASIEIQLRRRKNLLFSAYPNSLYARMSDVLLLLLLGSSIFSIIALFFFVRLLFYASKQSEGYGPGYGLRNSQVDTDISLVYLSLLFILTLFNVLTTFIYCSKHRYMPHSGDTPESKQLQSGDEPPCYDEVMANEKLYPIENIGLPLEKSASSSSS